MLIQDLMDLYPQIYHYVTAWLEHPEQIVIYIAEAKEKIAYFKYGIGGQCVPRGVMCADPFWEMDTQVTRGKLKDREPKRSEYYRYAFDCEGRLLMVEKYCDVDSVEVIRREGNIVYGFEVPIRELHDLFPNSVTIYGNVLVEGRTEAWFYTAKGMLFPNPAFSPKFPIGQFEGNVIQYENGLPVQYARQFFTWLDFDDNGEIVHIRGGIVNELRLSVNDEGDVVYFRYIKDDGSLSEPHNLEKPIPQEQWDNFHGLI